MNISGWNYDFETLPYWNSAENEPDPYELYESPDTSFCILNYGISEVRAQDFRGHLAIFKNKEAPEKIVEITKVNFFKETPFIASAKHIAAVLANVYASDIRQYVDVTVIIDLDKKRFSLAPIYQSDKRMLHPLAEAKGKVFLKNRDGSKRDFTKLTQYPLAKLPALTGVNIKVNMFNTVQVVPCFDK